LEQQMRRPRVLTLVLAAVCGVATTGCGPSGSGSSASSSRSGSGAVSGTITVFAAASLKESFTGLGRQFESRHAGTKVVFNFGPSSGLAAQIAQGAPADVFASASTKNMTRVTDAELASSATTFARNVMALAVPVTNPARVTQLSDLGRPAVKVAVCQSTVPCGTTAAKVFANAGLKVTAVSQEVDVKAVLAKVTLGEVDAGVVYVTDLRSAGAKVKGIAIPEDMNASTDYPIATLSTSANKTTAQAFTDLVLSDQGTSALARAGFSRP
jgi:molybdate transport system substrate-binding protein